jgi:hypothetical protein
MYLVIIVYVTTHLNFTHLTAFLWVSFCPGLKILIAAIYFILVIPCSSLTTVHFNRFNQNLV